jgi:hypothetical protein
MGDCCDCSLETVWTRLVPALILQAKQQPMAHVSEGLA